MRYNGNIQVVGEIQGLKPGRLAADPQGADLVQGLVWINTTDTALRWYDGVAVRTVATGGNLENYLNKAGGTLTGPLVLAADATEDLEAVTLQQQVAGLLLKQDKVTGAASTVVSADLTASSVVVTDSSGKLVASTLVSAAELDHLEGVTDNVQTQLDLKQDDIGYEPVNKAGDALTGDLNFGGTNTLKGLSAPVDPTSPVRLIDLDNMKAGLDFQADVLAMQVDNVLVPIEDVTPDSANRYIVSVAAELNEAFGVIAGLGDGDIIQKSGEVFVIAYDVSEKGPGALVWNVALTKFMKWDGSAWTEHGGLSGVTVSSGLLKEGNTISVKFGAGVANLPTGEVGIDVGPTGGLALLDPTSGLASTAADSVLSLLVKASGGLVTDATGVSIAPEGVTAAKIAEAALGNGLQGGAGVELSVKAANGTIVVAEEGVSVGDISASYLKLDAVSAIITGQIAVPAPTADASIANRKTVTDAVAVVAQSVTALTAQVEANQFVFDGTTAAAQETYSINHNLGSRFATVAVYDEAFNQIIPDSVTLTDLNNLTVTLAVAQKVHVVISGKKVVA